jgi:hypothetical protein
MDTPLIYRVFLYVKEMLLAQLSVSKAESTQIVFERQTGNCPNCWLQPQSRCICSKCTPISHKPSKLNRIFLLMHNKELMIKVDNTAKLLWAHFPETILVVSGISSKLPFSMAASSKRQCRIRPPENVLYSFRPTLPGHLQK